MCADLSALTKKLLVIVMSPGRQGFDDFLEIGQEILRQASDINVHILTTRDTASAIPATKWQLPTLTVAFNPLGQFVPERGRIFYNRQIKKLDQHGRFRACGIATPHTARFDFGGSYDEADFGRLAVLKPLPLNLTSFGDSVQLFRTRRLAELKAADFPPGHFLRKAPALVQQYIDTGLRPHYFRVLTLFGEPILWMRVSSPAERGNVDGTDDEIEQVVVDPRHKSVTKGVPITELLTYDVPEEVKQFGRRMYDAFPDIPLQACDVLREWPSGRLYAIEINAGGNTWDFSSRRVAEGLEKLGGRGALLKEFDPWPKAARALIAKVRECAS